MNGHSNEICQFHFFRPAIREGTRFCFKNHYIADDQRRRVGIIVTNRSRPANKVVRFYIQRGSAEQWIKEGKNMINWTRLSCHSLRRNEVRLQLHAFADNLGNFIRTLAPPNKIEHRLLTTLRKKLIKIGAKVVRHGRYITFLMEEVAIPRTLFAVILCLIDWPRPAPLPP